MTLKHAIKRGNKDSNMIYGQMVYSIYNTGIYDIEDNKWDWIPGEYDVYQGYQCYVVYCNKNQDVEEIKKDIMMWI